MRNEDFIRIHLVEESKKLVEAGFFFPAFFLVSQGIETLGAFIDKKPLAAKAQSKKRFNLAIQQLFSTDYKQLRNDNWLYKQLRCNISHMCSTGGFIILRTRSEKVDEHLDLIEGQRLFVIEDLVEDFHKACFEVIDLLEKEKLKQKAMALSEISSYKA
tara:strand:+ start:96 stop:572 length:477 start_codon:yes stop_codon:yes gene_type:complete